MKPKEYVKWENEAERFKATVKEALDLGNFLIEREQARTDADYDWTDRYAVGRGLQFMINELERFKEDVEHQEDFEVF